MKWYCDLISVIKNPDYIALFISLIALVISTYFNRLTYLFAKKIQRQSVLPVLRIKTIQDYNNLKIIKSIENVGLAAGVIIELNLEYKEIKDNQPYRVAMEIANDYEMDNNLESKTINIDSSEYITRYPIAKDESIILFSFENFRNKESLDDFVENYLKKYSLDIRYKDIFNNEILNNYMS